MTSIFNGSTGGAKTHRVSFPYSLKNKTKSKLKSPRASIRVTKDGGARSKGYGAGGAREILAEVFGIRLSEVDEMIQNCFQTGDKKCSQEDGLWPQELWVEG
jgi:hypothetical protein